MLSGIDAVDFLAALESQSTLSSEGLHSVTLRSCTDQQLEAILNRLHDLGLAQQVTLLSAKMCSLTRVPDEIAYLTELTDLQLQGNQITQVSSNIGALSKLNLLWLACNRLTDLPDSFATLKLSNLSLAVNYFITLPDVVCELSALRQLVLSGNTALTALPKKIDQLSSLQKLELSRCTAKLPWNIIFLNKSLFPDALQSVYERYQQIVILSCANYFIIRGLQKWQKEHNSAALAFILHTDSLLDRMTRHFAERPMSDAGFFAAKQNFKTPLSIAAEPDEVSPPNNLKEFVSQFF